MEQETRTVFERAQAIEEWVRPQRIANSKISMKERDSSLQHAFGLFSTLYGAACDLKNTAEEFSINPLSTINHEPLFRRSIEVDFLLPRFERWMAGEYGAQALVETIFEFCKNRVLDGGLSRMNYTCPIHNVVNAWTNDVYCNIMRRINQSVIRLAEERQREANQPKKRAKA